MKKGENIPGRNLLQSKNTLREFKIIHQLNDPNIRLLKVRCHGKEAIERNWQTKANYGIQSQIIQQWVKDGGNYGITSPPGFFCSVDADTKEIQDVLNNALPLTFRYSTGKAGHFQYAYFIEDSPIGCLPLKDGAYIKGKGGYALGPGSVHPNSVVYGSREIRDVPIAIVKKADLINALQEFVVGRESGAHRAQASIPKGSGQILTVLEKYGVDLSQYRHTGAWLRGSHPVHGSETGSNFAVNPESDAWHCFRHGTGGGIVSLIAVLERLIDCKDVQGDD